MYKYADLHIHSTASDGEYTPEQIVLLAKSQGFSAIALTDHDTVSGIEVALKQSKKIGLEFIPGVEISTIWNDKEIHILGYFIDYYNESLIEKLNNMKQSRKDRIKKMVIKLKELGYNIDFEQVCEISESGALGRPHVARILLKKGYVKTIKEAFNKLLSPGCPAYIPRYKITPQEAIDLILKAEGIPVLAHPGLNADDKIIPVLKEKGLIGVEVWHPEHDLNAINRYYSIAVKYGLLMTGGSDWHGNNKDANFALGSIKLDYIYVEKLKAKKEELIRWKRRTD